ncbi:MAG: hypothetical protein ACFFCW_39020 [Candidatus Hodarchaeota archaeon]
MEDQRVFKAVAYGEGSGTGAAIYANIGSLIPVLGDTVIIYTGVSSHARKTINGAEEIICAIAEQEGIDLQNTAFYDLQTYRGISTRKEGDFDFDKVTFDLKDGEPTNLGWQKVECPQRVITLFGGLIGNKPRQL